MTTTGPPTGPCSPISCREVRVSAADAPNPPEIPSPGRLSRVRNLVRAVVTTPIFLVGHLIRSRDIERSVEHVAEFSEPSPRPSVIDDDAGVQTAVDGEGPIGFAAGAEQRDGESGEEERAVAHGKSVAVFEGRP